MPSYHRVKDNLYVLFLQRNSGLEGLEKLQAYIDELKQSENFQKVILHFGDVKFVDSSGIAVTVKIFKDLVKMGVTVAICEMHKNIRELFAMTGFDGHMDIYATQDEAIAALSAE